jgi:hypothetical protein
LKRGKNGPKPSRYWTTEEKPTIEMSGGGFNRASFFCAARAVFRTLENYVSPSAIRDVNHVLPEEILTLWPPLQLPMWSSEAPLSNRQTERQAQGNLSSGTPRGQLIEMATS